MGPIGIIVFLQLNFSQPRIIVTSDSKDGSLEVQSAHRATLFLAFIIMLIQRNNKLIFWSFLTRVFPSFNFFVGTAVEACLVIFLRSLLLNNSQLITSQFIT